MTRSSSAAVRRAGATSTFPGRKEAAANIHIGIDWLSSVSFGHIDKIGKRVIILGGGNTAMDCCRSSRRLGGEDVKVIVRSGFEEMKASPWEKEDAMHEGIPIINFLVPKSFVHENGKLTGMTFEKVKAEYDDKGRRRLVPPANPTITSNATTCWLRSARRTLSRGSSATAASSSTNGECPRWTRSRFECDAARSVFRRRLGVRTRRTSSGPLHMVMRPPSRSTSSATARIFAPGLRRWSISISQKMGIHEWSYDNDVSLDQRYKVPWHDVRVTLKNIKQEVEKGFDPATAFKEAQRCLNCDAQTVFTGRCASSATRAWTSARWTASRLPTMAKKPDLRKRLVAPATNLTQDLYVSEALKTGRIMAKDEDVCLHCGLCAERCPTGAWDMQKFLLDMTQAGPSCRVHHANAGRKAA